MKCYLEQSRTGCNSPPASQPCTGTPLQPKTYSPEAKEEKEDQAFSPSWEPVPVLKIEALPILAGVGGRNVRSGAINSKAKKSLIFFKFFVLISLH